MAEMTVEEATDRARRFQDGGMSVTTQMVLNDPARFDERWARERQEDYDRWRAQGTAYDQRHDKLMSILKA